MSVCFCVTQVLFLGENPVDVSVFCVTQVLFLGENPVDVSVNLTKYGFKRDGLLHTLIIKNVDFADAGKYTCR